jgi:hypothetical protein
VRLRQVARYRSPFVRASSVVDAPIQTGLLPVVWVPAWFQPREAKASAVLLRRGSHPEQMEPARSEAFEEEAHPRILAADSKSEAACWAMRALRSSATPWRRWTPRPHLLRRHEASGLRHRLPHWSRCPPYLSLRSLSLFPAPLFTPRLARRDDYRDYRKPSRLRSFRALWRDTSTRFPVERHAT